MAENVEVRNFLCVSCPVGCSLSVGVRGTEVVQVEGNECPRGIAYAKSEVENPTRTFLQKFLLIQIIMKQMMEQLIFTLMTY